MREKLLPFSRSKKLRRAFTMHKSNAKRVGTPFLLTFPEWLHIWRQSGKLGQRGIKRGNNYVMARRGDVGPYAIDNVMIITNSENRRQGKVVAHWTGKKLSKEHKRKIGVGSRAYFADPKHRRKLSKAVTSWWEARRNGDQL